MAIPAKLLLEVVTPDRALAREEVDEVQAPGAEGYFGILPGHAPLLATLAVGSCGTGSAPSATSWRSPAGSSKCSRIA